MYLVWNWMKPTWKFNPIFCNFKIWNSDSVLHFQWGTTTMSPMSLRKSNQARIHRNSFHTHKNFQKTYWDFYLWHSCSYQCDHSKKWQARIQVNQETTGPRAVQTQRVNQKCHQAVDQSEEWGTKALSDEDWWQETGWGTLRYIFAALSKRGNRY